MIKMAIERVYNVPLRAEFLKVPRYRRAKKAANGLRSFLAKHMKVSEDNVKIGKYANLEIWKHGIKNPPHHIKVNVKKDDEGIVRAELVGAPEAKVEEKTKIAVKDAKKTEVKAADIKKVIAAKKEETKVEEKKEEVSPLEEAAGISKEEKK
jgi:large subunit ribosomal protein L31e